MSWIDGMLLGAILGVAAWRLLGPDLHPDERATAVGLLAAATLMLAGIEGFTWQFLPAWTLLLAAGWPRRRTGPTVRWIGRLAMVGLIGLTLVPWIVLPVPRLPAPDGAYGVATEIYRWTDATRAEPATADPADRRGVVVQAWYPTPRDAPSRRGRARLPYIDGLGHLPSQVSLFPSFVFHRFGGVDTHGQSSGPLADNARPWPVVIFSPGYGAPRAFYTGLVTQLASRGFVVLALDHPYEAAVTQLADGRVVGPQEHFLTSDPDRHRYMAGQLDVRAADVRFVLDRLSQPGALKAPLAGKLDLAHVAVIGHSFGGAAAAAALDRDPRVVAAANLDGTPYGDLPNHRLKGPFLVVMSDYAETHHSKAFLDGNGKLLAGATSGQRYEIKRANHFSFTDAPLFFSPPGRWLVARIIGGERGPADTQHAAADIVAAFLSGPLGLAPADVAVTAARYKDIVGGAVTPTPAL